MAKNYYVILGVAANASDEQIKTAFRRRALELHPDRSGRPAEPFLDVQEAYAVLADPDRRRHYDSQAAARKPGPPTAEPMADPRRPPPGRVRRSVSLADSFATYQPSFEELFDRFWRNFGDLGRPKSEHLESLTVEVVLDAEAARWGGQVRVRIPARATCPACRGHGSVGRYQCWRCEGQGALTLEYPVEVEVPPGLHDATAVRLPLTGFGIENFYLTVLLRVSQAPAVR